LTDWLLFRGLLFAQAMEKDEANAHTKEISQQFSKVTQALASSRAGETDEQTYARAMRDPEVQQIMSDPVFQSILQQAQQDPKSLQQHMMQNEGIRKKVEVLVRAVSRGVSRLQLSSPDSCRGGC
jgi:stress-induced-phosphoprotein 1